jgi:hypothetical protein
VELEHDHAADLCFVRLRQDGIGRAANVWQTNVVGAGTACECQKCESDDESGSL